MVNLQVCCLIIIAFIAGVYFPVKREKTYSHIIFSLSLAAGAFCIVFDIITVYTVNHLDSVSPLANRIFHNLFMGSLILEALLCYLYCLSLIYGKKVAAKGHWVIGIPVLISWVGLAFLPLGYVQTPKGNYSWGPAVFTVHGIVAFYAICMIVVLFQHWKEIDMKKRYIVILAFCIQLVVIIYQTLVPISLMSSMVVMLVNLTLFLTVESPDVLLMEKLKAEKERADEANEAKSQFLSSMSHEIRTPMNAIVGMTDIVLREELPSNVREYLNNIKNSGDALLTIINDILDFSKIESGKLEIVEEEYEPMSMLHDVSMIFLNRIGDKPVELLYDIDPDMPTRLTGDDQRVRQIVINLMNNAIKYTDSGYVRLKADVERLGEREMNLIFSVEDTGQGIREEDLGKLFNSFQQVDMKKNYKKEGTGLGLAISKQLVELMHGTIGVSSTYGEGSIFTFTIPQKIVDATPAARLKDDNGKEDLVIYRMESRVTGHQLKKLADSYAVHCICMDEPQREHAGGQLSDLIEKTAGRVFLITDDLGQISTLEKQKVQKKGGKICVLQNPMRDSISDMKVTVINKPIYSLNFCQLLNGEEQVFTRKTAEEFSFVAPKAKILVVDDNEMNLKVAKGLLAPYQMQIDIAMDGQQAVQMVKSNWYDLVLMDHMMPVMDGIEATAAIRKLEGACYQKLPIIALSANATSEARDLFLNAGMDDFISKPIREKELGECIQHWLPKAKMVEVEKTVETEDSLADGTSSEEAEQLPDIEGLDVPEGIKNSGSKALFMELIGDFYRLIDSKSEKLMNCLANDDLRNFTIEVHALKNNARMIGALELSQLFYQMEQLGNAENKEEIEKGMPKLMGLYQSYKTVLSQYAESPEEQKKQVSMDVIRKTLKQLHDAVDFFDLDTADYAMKELETYELPDEMKPMVEKLRICVSDVAMEDILNITETLDNMCANFPEGN